MRNADLKKGRGKREISKVKARFYEYGGIKWELLTLNMRLKLLEPKNAFSSLIQIISQT